MTGCVILGLNATGSALSSSDLHSWLVDYLIEAEKREYNPFEPEDDNVEIVFQDDVKI
jgi:hypothetical protein